MKIMKIMKNRKICFVFKLLNITLLLILLFNCSSVGTNDPVNEEKTGGTAGEFSGTIKSTSFDSIFTGTSSSDLINGLCENDYILGLGGNDTITGGCGHDIIYGGEGNDIIYGDTVLDIINQLNGNDLLVGGPGNDTLYAGRADSSVWFQGRNYNQLQGEDGNDKLYGGSDTDIIFPGNGDDKIYPGNGDDTVILRPGDGLNNRVYLDGGTDYVHLILDEPYMDRDATRVYIIPQKVSGTKTVWIQVDNTRNPSSNPDYTYTVTHAYYDSNRYTNFYVKVNKVVKFTITIKEYYSDPATHWVDFLLN